LGTGASLADCQYADEQEADCNHAPIMFRFTGDGESNGRSFRKRQVVGASGAPGANLDEACARAGLNKIRDRLK
jgi:hypothetical protein